MAEQRKETKEAKEKRILRSKLIELVDAAERVSRKYGTDEKGTPSDWEEWVELRRAIQQSRSWL